MIKKKYTDPIKCKILLNEIFDCLVENKGYLIKKYFEESVLEEKVKKSRFERVCIRCGKTIFKKQLYFSRILQDLGNFSYCLECHKKNDCNEQTVIKNNKLKFMVEQDELP